MKLVFLGPPGAGKGTVASILKKEIQIVHISTGDIFRENIKKETPLGLKVKQILATGGLVSDDITCELVKNRLQEDDVKNGFILDGFPRTVAQAEFLSSFLKIDAAIEFDISDSEVIERLSGRRVCPSTGRTYHITFNPPKVAGKDDETEEDLIQREDDKSDAIANRLKIYHSTTEPIIDYYKKLNLIYTIKCDRSSDEVAKEILKIKVEK